MFHVSWSHTIAFWVEQTVILILPSAVDLKSHYTSMSNDYFN